MPQQTTLTGRTVLVVEDDPLIALDIADTLRGAGVVVAGPATRLSKALRLVDEVRIDAAAIDVRLDRDTTNELANRLTAARVPVPVSDQRSRGYSGGLRWCPGA